MMTLTQYKKVIKSLTRDELETHLFEMFKSSKVFKDIESSCWSRASNDELMVSLQKRLEKVFWKAVICWITDSAEKVSWNNGIIGNRGGSENS